MNTNPQTITILAEGGLWFARFSDPAVVEAFGTDTIPTPYTTTIDPRDVVDAMASLNPEAAVLLDAS